VQQALHTAIHRYEVNGEKHFANTSDPAVPAVLAGLVGGFEGLHDFQPRPSPIAVTPDYNSGAIITWYRQTTRPSTISAHSIPRALTERA